MRKNVQERLLKLRDNPEWRLKERERTKEKYHRLGYASRPRPNKEAVLKNLHKKLRIPKGLEGHHWSYEAEYLEDVIIMNPCQHKRLHALMERSGKNFLCKKSKKILTKEDHLKLIENLS